MNAYPPTNPEEERQYTYIIPNGPFVATANATVQRTIEVHQAARQIGLLLSATATITALSVTGLSSNALYANIVGVPLNPFVIFAAIPIVDDHLSISITCGAGQPPLVTPILFTDNNTGLVTLPFSSTLAVTLPTGQAVEVLDAGGVNKLAVDATGAAKVQGVTIANPVTATNAYVSNAPKGTNNSNVFQQTSTAASAQLVVARATRNYCQIRNEDAANSVWVNTAAATVTSKLIKAGESFNYQGLQALNIIDNGAHAVVDVFDYFD